MQGKDDVLQINFGAPRSSIWVQPGWSWSALVGAGWRWLALVNAGRRWSAKCATCSWEILTLLNLQWVAGEHGLFGGHESEGIWTIFFWIPNRNVFLWIRLYTFSIFLWILKRSFTKRLHFCWIYANMKMFFLLTFNEAKIWQGF